MNRVDKTSTPSTLFNYSNDNSGLNSDYENNCDRFNESNNEILNLNIFDSCTIYDADNSIDFSDGFACNDSNMTTPQHISQTEELIQLQASIFEEPESSDEEVESISKCRHFLESALSRYSLDNGGFMINTETAELSSLVNNNEDFEFTSGIETSPITPAMIKKYGNIYKMMSGKFSCEKKLSVVQYHQIYSSNAINNFQSSVNDISLDESYISIDTSKCYSDSDICSSNQNNRIDFDNTDCTFNKAAEHIVLDTNIASNDYVELQTDCAEALQYEYYAQVEKKDDESDNVNIESSYKFKNRIEAVVEIIYEDEVNTDISTPLSPNMTEDILLEFNSSRVVSHEVSSETHPVTDTDYEIYNSRSSFSLLILAFRSSIRRPYKKTSRTSTKPRCRFMFK